MIVKTNQIRTAKLISEDSRDYLKLIRDNKDRLVRYFPLTTKSADSFDTIKESVKLIIQKAVEKEVFCFCIRHNELLIGLFFIKSIDWEQFKCEFAYFIDTNYESKGVTSFVFPKMINFCFDNLKMKKIFLRIDPLNHASIRIAKKKGFKKIKVVPNDFKIETGELIDLIHFELMYPNFASNEF